MRIHLGAPGAVPGPGAAPGVFPRQRAKGIPGLLVAVTFVGFRTRAYNARAASCSGTSGKGEISGITHSSVADFLRSWGKPRRFGALFIAGVSPGAEEEWEHCKEKV